MVICKQMQMLLTYQAEFYCRNRPSKINGAYIMAVVQISVEKEVRILFLMDNCIHEMYQL